MLDTGGPDVAKRVLSELQAKLELLTDFPKMGRRRPELTDEKVLFFPFYSWLIVYQVEAGSLVIVRVVSSFRNPSNIL